MGELGVVVFIFYGSLIFCIITSIFKIRQFITAPMHLRWEIYTINPKEEKIRSASRQLTEKIKDSASNILFLKGYFKNNRKLWYPLYLFHLGLYLLILWHVSLFLFSFNNLGGRFYTASIIWGDAATAMVAAGGIAILATRVAQKKLREDYSRINYVKWVLIAATALGGSWSVNFFFGHATDQIVLYVEEQLRFNMAEKLSPPVLPALHVLLVSVWLVYLPFSHIIQVISRYYHQFRWDHVFNWRGSEMENEVKKVLDKPLTWSAPHVKMASAWKDLS